MNLFKANNNSYKPTAIKTVAAAYKLSQPKELSRLVWYQNKNINVNRPSFNKHGFMTDIKKLPENTKNLQELVNNVIAISDEYIFPAKGFVLLLKQKDKYVPFGNLDRIMLTADELGIDNKNSFFNYVARSMRTTYVPGVRFEQCKGMYQLPKETSKLFELEEKVTLQGIEDVNKLNVDYNSLATKVSKHSASVVLLPLVAKDIELGMMAFSFGRFNIFNNEPNEMDLNHIMWFHLLADAVSLTLEKLFRLGQKI